MERGTSLTQHNPLGQSLAPWASQPATAGFRTQDTYVFCIGPDGVMSAHPSALLQGHDVRDLHDQTGNYFIAAMLKMAVAGEVLDMRYLFRRPGSTIAATPEQLRADWVEYLRLMDEQTKAQDGAIGKVQAVETTLTASR